MPTTRTVSIRTFRENMTKFLRDAQEKDIHFVVMRHTEPVAHIVPVRKKVRKKNSLESLAADIAEARKAAKEGRVYTPEQVLDMIGR